MENKHKLEELKQLIRSLLISYRNGLTLRQFLRRFKDEIGYELPFRQLGFESVLNFLREIDDCVGILVQDNHQNELDFIVFAKSDHKTDHIKRLVDGQKQDKDKTVLNPNSGNYVDRRPYNKIKTFKPYSLEANENDLELNHKMSNMRIGSNQRNGKHRAVCPLPYNRVIPVSDRMKIKQLMDKFYEGINIYNFPIVYKLTHGHYPQYKEIGYSCLEEYLMDLSDFVKLVDNENGIQIIAVKSLRNSSERSINRLNKKTENTKNDSIVGFHKANEIPKKQSIHGSFQEDTVNNSIGVFQNKNESASNQLVNDFGKDEKLVSMIPQKELDNFRTILRKNPNGMPANKFTEEYFKRFRVPLIVGKWGFGSPLEMFCALDVFHLKKPENQNKDMDEWILVESSPATRTTKNESGIKRKRFDRVFKMRVLYIIKKIYESNPKSLFLVEDFAAAYHIVYDENIEAQQYGYKTMKQLFTDLSKEIDIDVKEKVKNQPYLIYKNKGLKIK